MKLQPTPNTAILCNSQEEFNAVIKILAANGFIWRVGEPADTHPEYFHTKTIGFSINITSQIICWWTKEHYEHSGFTILSLQDIQKIVGEDTTQNIPPTKVCKCNIWVGCTCGAIKKYSPY